jgi:hypothetical protein
MLGPWKTRDSLNVWQWNCLVPSVYRIECSGPREGPMNCTVKDRMKLAWMPSGFQCSTMRLIKLASNEQGPCSGCLPTHCNCCAVALSYHNTRYSRLGGAVARTWLPFDSTPCISTNLEAPKRKWLCQLREPARDRPGRWFLEAESPSAETKALSNGEICGK